MDGYLSVLLAVLVNTTLVGVWLSLVTNVVTINSYKGMYDRKSVDNSGLDTIVNFIYSVFVGLLRLGVAVALFALLAVGTYLLFCALSEGLIVIYVPTSVYLFICEVIFLFYYACNEVLPYLCYNANTATALLLLLATMSTMMSLLYVSIATNTSISYTSL